MNLKKIRIAVVACLMPLFGQAQNQPAPSADALTLEQCVKIALQNQPQVRQAMLDEAIGERQIKSSLSGWLPQVYAQYNYNHFLKRQVIAFGENVTRVGRNHTSNVLFEANQALFSNELMLAARAGKITRLQLDQNTAEVKINMVVEVSKAYYAVLLTREELRILEENINRQQKQYEDALARYESGIVDKTDYQRATISLSTSRSDRKRTQEAQVSRLAYLKQLMGYPAEKPLTIAPISTSLTLKDVLIDTLQHSAFNNRIEYKQLETEQQLLKLNTRYYRWEFLPTIDGFINYNLNYLNDELPQLYNQSFPSSVLGLSASIPIFQGTRRIQNLHIAKMREQRLGMEMENTRNIINTQYQTALANYKSDLTEWRTLEQNAKLAQEVYDIIKLQYDEGIKAYIDLVAADVNLKTAQVSYYYALFKVLTSRLDVEQALGVVQVP